MKNVENLEVFDEESFLPWFDTQKEIKRCNKIYNKSRKHKKDNTRKYRDTLRITRIDEILWGCDCYKCCVANDVTMLGEELHKHLRAQKVYNEDEWYDHDSFDDTHYESIEENNWFLREIGLPHLASDFDCR